jgi:hypothetical protein
MSRFVVSLSAATLVLVGGVVAGSSVGGAGQPETVPSTEPAAVTTEAAGAVASTELHPVVGAWILTVDDDPGAPPTLGEFSAEGTYHDAEYDGLGGIGAWEATGPNSAALTFIQQFPSEDGESGESVTIRATLEVDPDGQSFSGEYTIEFGGEGGPPGEYGPGTVTATRIVVEPMGEPAGSLEDLFGQFEEGTEPASGGTTAEMAPPTTS